MPGIFYHIACANLIRKSVPELDTPDFFLGNFIPDLAVDKNISHYRYITRDGWLCPNLALAEADFDLYINSFKDLFDLSTSEEHINKPLLLGIFCHLFLDDFFIKYCLSRKFFASNTFICRKKDGRCWTYDQFLSKQGLYGAYSGSNLLLIRDGYIPSAEIFSLPDNPPLSGIPAEDQRSSIIWKKEIEKYLGDPTPYSDNFFSYDELQTTTITAAAKIKDNYFPAR